MTTAFDLDLYSDVVCPWCYLGHSRLATAIEEAGLVDEVNIRWRSFQLDPRADSTPGDLKAAIDHKYGPGSFEGMSARLTALGAEAGIEYNFDIAKRVGTRDAHRLIQWTQASPATQSKTDAVAMALFGAYFTEGKNIASHDVLISIAESIGLDRTETTEFLASDQLTDVVLTDQSEAMEYGVTGVPAVVYNGAIVIPGAQDTETMAAILKRIHAKVVANA